MREIKRAFRKLAQQWHPDVNKDPDGAGALQGDQRGLPGPVRPGAAPALRHVRAGRGRWRRRPGAGFEGFGGFSDIFDAFFGGGDRPASARRGRPQAGSDLRYDLRITFEEAVTGTEKEIDFRVARPVRDVRRHRRHARDASPRPARSATVAARSAASARRCSARWSTSRPARAAGARAGSSRRRARRAGRRPDRAQAHAPGDDPGGHRRGPPDPPHRTRARSGRAAGRPASCTSRSTSRRTRALKRDGTELFYEAHVSIAQAALGTTLIVPTVEGERGGRDQGRHAARDRDPAARQGRAAPAPHRVARRPPRPRRRRRPDASSRKKQRELLEAYAERVGRVGRRAGGHPRQARARHDVDDAAGESQAPGSSCRSRRTSRRSRRSARSSGAWRPAARASSRRSSWSTRGWARASTRPGQPIVRGVRAGTRPRPRRSAAVAEVSEALGHLQAFGLRPIGELRTRRRRRGRLGRRVEGSTSRCCGSAGGS